MHFLTDSLFSQDKKKEKKKNNNEKKTQRRLLFAKQYKNTSEQYQSTCVDSS